MVSSRFHDDTDLDAIAAQVRSFTRLPEDQLAVLLEESRQVPAGVATARLVEQHLGAVLDAVLGRRGSGLDLMDLYQEGSIAATVAVGEYALRGGSAAGLRPYVVRVVEKFLDDVVDREESKRRADTLLIENLKLLEAAEVVLRRRLERDPTTLELAAVLRWTPDAVAVVGSALHQARREFDSEILQFLDDVDDDGGGAG